MKAKWKNMQSRAYLASVQLCSRYVLQTTHNFILYPSYFCLFFGLYPLAFILYPSPLSWPASAGVALLSRFSTIQQAYPVLRSADRRSGAATRDAWAPRLAPPLAQTTSMLTTNVVATFCHLQMLLLAYIFLFTPVSKHIL